MAKARQGIWDAIAKKLIPQEYIQRYGITNLFRVEPPDYWRMLYTLLEDRKAATVFVIDILDHKSYDKKFGYK